MTGRRERVRRKSTQTGTLGPFSRSLPDGFFSSRCQNSEQQTEKTHSLTHSVRQSVELNYNHYVHRLERLNVFFPTQSLIS